MQTRNKVERRTDDGNCLVTGDRIVSSNSWTFLAWVQVEEIFFAPDKETGTRFTDERGVRWELLGSHPRVLKSLDSPDRMAEKRAALKAQDYSWAYDLILTAYPQTAAGTRREGKIEVLLDQDPE